MESNARVNSLSPHEEAAPAAREQPMPAAVELPQAGDDAAWQELADLREQGRLRHAHGVIEHALAREVPEAELLALVDEVVRIYEHEEADVAAAERVLAQVERARGADDVWPRRRAALLLRAGRAGEAYRLLERLASRATDERTRADLEEQLGDLCRTRLARLPDALRHYRMAHHGAPDAVGILTKAARVAFDMGLLEEAKAHLDRQMALLAAAHEGGSATSSSMPDALRTLYIDMARSVLMNPAQHVLARDVIERIRALAPDDSDALEVEQELKAFASQWRYHVRHLRELAMAAKDKRKAAQHHVDIARILQHFEPQQREAIQQSLERAMLLAPGHRPALKMLEALHRAEGDMPAFLQRLQAMAKELRVPEQSVELRLAAAVVMAEQGVSPRELAAWYEEVLALDPRNAAATHALTEILLTEQNFEGAAEQLEDFLAKTAEPEVKRATLRELARIYEVELADPDRAAARLEMLRTIEASDGVLLHLARLYEEMLKPERLAPVLEQLLAAGGAERYPEGGALGLKRRLVTLYRESLDGPVQAFAAARQLFVAEPEPTLESELRELAELLARPADLALTFQVAARQHARPGERQRLGLAAAREFIRAGSAHRARDVLEGLMREQPDNVEVLDLLQSLLPESSRAEDLARVLEARLLIQRDPESRAAVLLKLSEMYTRLRRHADAADRLRALLATKPDHALALERLDACLRQEGDWAGLVDVLASRIALVDASEHPELAAGLSYRIAQLLDEKLERPASAAEQYLVLFSDQMFMGDAGRAADVTRALENLFERGIATLDIARALETHYARVGSWRRCVDMLTVRRDHEEDPRTRAPMSRQIAGVLEEQLRSPREAMDAWCAVLLDEPAAADALRNCTRLAARTQSHARLARVLEEAAERLPEGMDKHRLLEQRAALLQGVLGDQAAALDAHRVLLEKNPEHLPTLDALIALHEQREEWGELETLLVRRIELADEESGAPLAARLARLYAEQFQDPVRARPYFTQAFAQDAVSLGAGHLDYARLHVAVMRDAYVTSGSRDDAAAWARSLTLLAPHLAGRERAETRVQLGDVYRVAIEEHELALGAYEAALANDPDNALAEAGVRALLDEANAPGQVRRSAARLLMGRYAQAGNVAGRAHVLSVQLHLEDNPSTTRQIVRSLASLFREELEDADEAFAILLRHMMRDPLDEVTRTDVEAHALETGRGAEVLSCWKSLRDVEDQGTARLYCLQVASLAERLEDDAELAAALDVCVARNPTDESLLERLRDVKDRLDDNEGVAACLEGLANFGDEAQRVERCFIWADYCFAVLDDPERGLQALRSARACMPGHEPTLLRLHASLQEFGPAEELAEVLETRARLAQEPEARAALWLELATLLIDPLVRIPDAIRALREVLELDREGPGVMRATDLLQQLARREDANALAAIDVILSHYRALQAWPPLVEALELAAGAHAAGEPRACLLDELSLLHEVELRSAQTAFRDACRAFHEAPTDARQRRARQLAETTGSESELGAVFEDVAEGLAADGHVEPALELYRELRAWQETQPLDEAAHVRVAEAICRLDPADRPSFSLLRAHYRARADDEALGALLDAHLAHTKGTEEHGELCVALGRLRLRAQDYAAAETLFRDALAQRSEEPEALQALDELYEATGDLSTQLEVIRQRIAGADDVGEQVALQTRLATLLFERKGEAAAAFACISEAVAVEPAFPQARALIESLLRASVPGGVPSPRDVARLLEYVLRAQGDWQALPALVEPRLVGEEDRAVRAQVMREVALVYEERLSQPDLAFTWLCHALQESPEDGALRREAERLAQETENQDTLADLYRDLLERVTETSLRSQLHRRIADLAERIEGDVDSAMRHLHAAVQDGVRDVETLRTLSRLTRTHADVHVHADVLRMLCDAAALAEDRATFQEACSEFADVAEEGGDREGAIRSLERLLEQDDDDRAARHALLRMQQAEGAWPKVVQLWQWEAEHAPTPTERAFALASLARIHAESLRDPVAALDAFERLAREYPQCDTLVEIGEAVWAALDEQAGPESAPRADGVTLRQRLAVILEPRYEAAANWDATLRALQARIEGCEDAEQRQRLWLRVIDLHEREMQNPERAFIATGRALMNMPQDTFLREKAERLSVRLDDVDTLLAFYEEVAASLDEAEPLRVAYLVRGGELCESALSDPARAASLFDEAYRALRAQGGALAEQRKLLARQERVLRTLGEPDRLVTLLQARAGCLDDDDPERSGRRRQLLLEAATIQVHGLAEDAGAIETLNQLLADAPGDLTALRAKSEACLRLGRWEEAASCLQRWVEEQAQQDPAAATEARYQLGVLLDRELGRTDEAFSQFSALLEVAPAHAPTRAYLEQRMSEVGGERSQDALYLRRSYERTGEWARLVELLRQQIQEAQAKGQQEQAKELLRELAALQRDRLQQQTIAFGTLCTAFRYDPADAAVCDELVTLASAADLVEEACEILDEEASRAGEEGEHELAGDLRERIAALFLDPIGDVDRAVETLEAVLVAEPERQSAFDALTALFVREGRWTALEQVLRRRLVFLDDPADRVPLLLALGRVLVDELDRPEEALPLLEEVRAAEPGHAAARRLLIEVYEGVEQHEEVRRLLEEEIRHCAEHDEFEQGRAARRRLALLVTDQLLDPALALRLWEEIRAEDPADEAASAALEQLYRAAARWDDVKVLLEDRLRHTRDVRAAAALTAALGEVLADHLSDPDAAIAHHLAALEASPRSDTHQEALRTLYRRLERWEDLVSLLRRMMRQQSDVSRLKALRFDLAEVLCEQLGKRAEAIETGRRILDIEAHDELELRRLARLFRLSDAYEEQVRVLRELANLLEGGERAATLWELAQILDHELHRAGEAAAAYEGALRADPTQEGAYERLCELLGNSAQWTRLIAIKDERVQRLEERSARVALLREVGALYEGQLAQREMAFLTACRAFREDYDDAELAGWTDRLGVGSDSVEELVAVYEDALLHLTREDRVVDTHLRIAELAIHHLVEPSVGEQHLRRVLEYRADHPAALAALSSLYSETERWRDLIAVMERRFDLATSPEEQAGLLGDMADIHEQRVGDVDAASAAYRRWLELSPSDRIAFERYAELLQRHQQWSALVQLLARQADSVPDVPEKLALQYRVASVWEQELRDPGRAVALHGAILEEDPGYEPSLQALERLHGQLGHAADLIDVFERMLSVADDDAERIVLLEKIARTWEERFGDLERAIEANQRLLALHPAHIPTLRAQARLYRDTQAWEPLLEVLARHVALVHEPSEAARLHLERGHVLSRELERVSEAEVAYQHALSEAPGNRAALRALGDLYEATGNWASAVERMSEEASLAGATPEAVSLYTRIARIHTDVNQDAIRAKAAYQSALDLEPGHLPALRALKEMALAQGDHDEYLRWLRSEAAYTTEERARAQLHIEAGRHLLEVVGDTAEAAEEFERALAVSPEAVEAARPLAEICFEAGRWARCEPLLETWLHALRDAPKAEWVRPLYRLGYVSEKLGKASEALAYFKRAYDIDPGELPVLEGLVAALDRAGQWESATHVLYAILQHHRDALTDAEVVEYHAQQARMFESLGREDRAIQSVEKALAIDDAHDASLVLAARVYERAGRFEDAYDASRKRASLQTGAARVPSLLALGEMCVRHLADPYRAIEAFEEASRLTPRDVRTLQPLIELYRQTGQSPRAMETLRLLLDLASDVTEKVKLHHQLGELYRDDLAQPHPALHHFNAALDLDPTHLVSFQAAETYLGRTQNWAGLEALYLAMLKRLSPSQEAMKRELWRNLAGLYHHRLRHVESAVQAYAVLHKLEPENLATLEALGEMQARIPARVPEAVYTFQRLRDLSPEQPQKALHALVRLHHHLRKPDRAFQVCQALRALGDLRPDEAQLWEQCVQVQRYEARAPLTPKLWDAVLTHPAAQGPVAELSALLWRGSASAFAQAPRSLGLDKGRLWVSESLDAPVPTFFVTQLKKVRSTLGLGDFGLFVKQQSADPLHVLPLERPALGVGSGNEVFREMSERQLRYLAARQVAHFRPEFMLPTVLGAPRFQAAVEAALRLWEPRYPATADVRTLGEFERLYARLGPGFANAIRGPVSQLLIARQAVQVRPFLEGMELTASRVAFVVTGDADLALGMMRAPDVGVTPLAFGARFQDWLQFVASEDHFELRERLGMAVGAG